MLNKKDIKIVITGGHLTPARAIISALKRLGGFRVLFIGRKYALEGDLTLSLEYQIIQQLGIESYFLTTGRLQRQLTRHTLSSLAKIPIGFIRSFWCLNRFKPDIIVSFGGYIALPVSLAGWLLRIPVVTHEQTLSPGLATKVISLFARRICVGWPKIKGKFPKEKVVLTGNPIREEIFTNPTEQRIKISEEKLPLIYITGGSLGAHAINRLVAKVLPELLEKYRIIHQCGDSKTFNDYENLRAIEAGLSPRIRDRYFLTTYVGSADIGWVFNHADLVVSRAGANIITELAALGIPAILIPLPWAGQGEQEKNARYLAEAGTAIVLTQEGLTGIDLLSKIDEMIGNLNRYKINGEKTKKLVDRMATQKIIDIILEVYHENNKPTDVS